MADQEVTLDINVEVDRANKNLSSFESNAKSMSSNVDKAFSAIKLAAAGAVAIFAGREVVKFFSEGIDAAIAQEKAMSNLAQQLKLTGSFSDDALKQFGAFADEMESTTNISDDVILSQIAIAKSFGITNDEAKKLVKGAVELSSATGQSLDGAVQALGKTFSGVTGKLDEQIPVLKNLTKEQLASGKALDIVIERFGGTAQANIQNFAGQIENAKNSFGNFQESIGAIITSNPVVIKSIQVLGEAFKIAQKFIEDNKDAIADFISLGVKAIAVSVPVAIDVLGFFIRALQGLASVGTLAFGGLLEVVSFFAQGFGKAIETMVGLYTSFIGAILEGVGKIPFLGDALKDLGFDTEEASKGIESIGLAITDTVSKGVSSIGNLRDSTIKFAATNVDKFNQFNEGFDNFSKGVDDAVQSIFDADQKVIDNAQQTSNKISNIEEERAKRINAIREEEAKKNTEIAKKQADEANKIYQDQLKAAASANKTYQDQRAKEEAEFQKLALGGIGVVSDSLNGRQGAVNTVSKGVSLGFGGGPVGDAIGGIAGQLAAGPEQTKAMVKAFVEALPDIITAIAESIPVVVDTLVTYLVKEGGAVKIGIAIIEGAFSIIGSLGKGLGLSFTGTVGDNISIAFGNVFNYFRDQFGADIKKAFSAIFDPFIDFFKNFRLPEFKVPGWLKDFIGAIGKITETPGWVKELQKIADKLSGIGNIGGKGQGLVPDKVPILGGLATGGRIPSGFPNDSYVAGLTSGERVLNTRETEALDNLIAKGGLGSDLTPLIGLLAKISGQLENQQTSVDVKVNSEVFAKMILNLNRRGARLTA